MCLQAHIKGIDEEYVMDQPQQRGQWLVSARLDGVLSIMTPVYPDDENLSLLLNQVADDVCDFHASNTACVPYHPRTE